MANLRVEWPSSKLGLCTNPMLNYFYTDANGQKQGPINDQLFRVLVAQKKVLPDNCWKRTQDTKDSLDKFQAYLTSFLHLLLPPHCSYRDRRPLRSRGFARTAALPFPNRSFASNAELRWVAVGFSGFFEQFLDEVSDVVAPFFSPSVNLGNLRI